MKICENREQSAKTQSGNKLFVYTVDRANGKLCVIGKLSSRRGKSLTVEHQRALDSCTLSIGLIRRHVVNSTKLLLYWGAEV